MPIQNRVVKVWKPKQTVQNHGVHSKDPPAIKVTTYASSNSEFVAQPADQVTT